MKKWKIVLVLGLLIVDIGLLFWIKYKDKKTSDTVVYLTGVNYPKTELEKTFLKYKKDKVDNVKAIITSHHFLAKDLIGETFSKIDGEKIERVIIVSPDHFKQIKDKKCLIMTANVGWKNDFGQIEADSLFIKNISKNDNYCQNGNSFLGEHGIYTLIPFVKNYLPKAKIIPLIFRVNNNYVNFYELGKNMATSIEDDKTLLIVSSDFSHYISKDEAKKQDLESIKILKQKNIKDVGLVKNDCPQCVAFMFGYLNNEVKFNLIKNTNSFEISNKDADYVTSYVGGFYNNN